MELLLFALYSHVTHTLATSPGTAQPPSEMTRPLRPWAASAHSMTALYGLVHKVKEWWHVKCVSGRRARPSIHPHTHLS